MRVLLLGYYGYRNIGDDLFVENLLIYLAPISSKIRVICNEDYYKSRFAGKDNIEFICSSKLSKLSRFFAIVNSDFIAWGGGTLQIDQKPKSLIGIQKMSRVLRKRFGFLGVGLKGTNSQDVQLGETVKGLFSRSNFLYLRDRDSYDFAITEFDTLPDLINLGGDLAFLRLDLYKPFIKATKSSTIRNLSLTGKHWWGESRAKFYAKLLLQLIENYGTKIHLLPGSMNKKLGDNLFHERLRKFLPEENCMLHTWNTPEEFLDILGKMDFHIGNRLHSIIIADILGIPNIGISSASPKIKSYIRKTSLLEQERIAEFMEEITIDRINRVIREYERPVKFIEEESSRARQCLDQVFNSGL